MITSIRTCTIDDCNRKHVANGLCRKHYDQNRNDSRFKCKQLSATLTRIAEIAEASDPFSHNMEVIARIARRAVLSVAKLETGGAK